MPRFNLSPALVPSGARRTYRIPLLGVELDVAPMTKANKAFWAEFLAMSTANAAAGAGGPPTEETQARYRRSDAILMGKHVLVGWRGVTDVAGKEVAFSAEAAGDFLLELATTEGAEHLFDDLRAFVQNDDHFTNAGIAAARALGGNSQSG